VNNPEVTIAVVLDSAVGLHQGGQISAPVFTRIAQQVLEYLHTPHDTEIPASRQTLLAEAKENEKDLEEGSPDHPGDSIDEVQATPADMLAEAHVPVNAPAKSSVVTGAKPAEAVVPAALRQSEPIPQTKAAAVVQGPARNVVPLPSSGTIVVDVEQGGIVVPSFLGKSVRSSIEMAQNSGLELDVLGSGRGMDQSPPPGSHVASGSRIMVKFGR
jgi:hypothetical protein